MKKIGIDARFWGLGSAGLGRYTIELINNLADQDSENEYYLLLNQQGFDQLTLANKNFHKVLVTAGHYSYKEQMSLPWQLKKLRLDLIHFTQFSYPIFYRQPFVVTIHDLILTDYPAAKKVSSLKQSAYHFVMNSAIKNSQKIIAVSKFVSKQIQKEYQVPSSKLVTIYEAADQQTYHPRNQAMIKPFKQKYQLHKPYLLFTGQWRVHKNLLRLVEAFNLLKDKNPNLNLVFVGKKDPRFPELPALVKKLKLNHKIKFTGFVPEEDLPLFYNGALAFVFPSVAEGFGLPPLEAMASGTPVISSNVSCMPEILGDAAHYFDPYSIKDMAKKINEVIHSRKLQTQLVDRGFKQVQKYNYQKMARQTQQVYLEVLAKQNRVGKS